MEKQREKIIRSAALLFRRAGFAATGTNDIVVVSGAPKGSLYHYFPGGKDEIAEAAITYAGRQVGETLAELVETSTSPSQVVQKYGKLLSEWLADSNFQDGCPISTVMLELAPRQPEVTRAGQQAFRSWIELLQSALLASGIPAKRASNLATLAIAAFEGALILARAERNVRPIKAVAAEVARMFDQAAT